MADGESPAQGDAPNQPDALSIAVALVKASEGCKLSAYQDPAGIWTVGYGHTGPGVFEHLVISQEQADMLLTADLAIAQHAVILLAPILARETHKQAAIIDFVYNEGAGRFHDSTLRNLINGMHWDAVPVELAKWVWAGGKVLPGLVTRRKAEAALWLLPS
jgi:lysozyme